MSLARRSFLGGGLLSVLAAPVIVRYKSIMPVRLVRWIERPSGVMKWESYPWAVTVDYDKLDPYHIDLDQVRIECAYTPPGYDPLEGVHLNAFGLLSGKPAPYVVPAVVMTLPGLRAANEDSFRYVSPKELHEGAVPKVIADVLKSSKA